MLNYHSENRHEKDNIDALYQKMFIKKQSPN